ALDNIDTRKSKAPGCEPPLRLDLRRGARCLGALCEKNDVPPPIGRPPPERCDNARLDFPERFPEAVDRLDMTPETALLPRGQLELQDRGNVSRRFVTGRLGCRRHLLLRSPLLLERTALLAKEDLGLPKKLGVHVGEHAVQIERNSQGQRRPLSASGGSKPIVHVLEYCTSRPTWALALGVPSAMRSTSAAVPY